jgi:hypothetical protein
MKLCCHEFRETILASLEAKHFAGKAGLTSRALTFNAPLSTCLYAAPCCDRTMATARMYSYTFIYLTGVQPY